MGRTKRRQIKSKQAIKRKANRDKLKEKGLNPDEHYVSGKCLRLPKK